jgi:hypothetical protein
MCVCVVVVCSGESSSTTVSSKLRVGAPLQLQRNRLGSARVFSGMWWQNTAILLCAIGVDSRVTKVNAGGHVVAEHRDFFCECVIRVDSHVTEVDAGCHLCCARDSKTATRRKLAKPRTKSAS